jgi:hypothetical protein
MKNTLTLLGFFILTPFVLTLAFTLTLTLSYTSSKAVLGASEGFSANNAVAYAALPSNSNESFSIEFEKADAKVELVRQFLEKHNSPMEPHAKTIVETAEKYGLDYRLLPAIAMQESNLCKKVREDSAHNCWGYAIYGGKGKAFDSYVHAIETVSESLSRKYKNNNGLVTPSEIESMYNPNSNGSWAFSVEFFMDQME